MGKEIRVILYGDYVKKYEKLYDSTEALNNRDLVESLIDFAYENIEKFILFTRFRKKGVIR